MSTFSGEVVEIPQIRVDNFTEVDSEIEAYFLSHCHSDHMKGLHTNFREIFRGEKCLYASEISCLILRKKYPDLQKNLRKLDMSTPTAIQLKDQIISVTPIPAGHCPGSLMFIFNVENKTVLYTGDYRISASDFKKINGFYNSYGQLKTIDNMYLDTTFFLTKFRVFPPRNKVVDDLCAIMKEWMDKDKNNMINLHTSASFGYEYIFKEIYKRLKTPIHLHDTTYDVYKYFPDLNIATTTNGDITQIHSYCNFHHFRICKENANVKYIKLSAMKWHNYEESQPSFSIEKEKTFVCYSTHASFEEGMEFIKFLKPKAIQVCVLQRNEKDNSEMNKLIKDVLNEINGDKNSDSSDIKSGRSFLNEFLSQKTLIGHDKVSSVLLPALPNLSDDERELLSSPQRDDNSDDSDFLDSPPLKIAR